MADAGFPATAVQVDEARSLGARVLHGGGRTQVDGMGRFFEPTLVQLRRLRHCTCSRVH